MSGFASEWLVMVKARVEGDDGDYIGTGYIVGADLILTASHVIPEGNVSELQVRTEHDAKLHAVLPVPVWRDATLDAMLLRLASPLPKAPEISWVEADFEDDAQWHSSGYPVAAKIERDGQTEWKTVGLGGSLHAHGGGGQGLRELELTVEAPPPAEQWAGISGAPVFVGDRLAGLIKEVPESFQGSRLAAVPATVLLQSHGFRLALASRWLEPLPQGIWVLTVLSEANKGTKGLADWVDGVLKKDSKSARELESDLGSAPHPESVRVRITEALQSPGHWLRFVRALCAAPIAVFDATGFEPAVMLALGVRAVVRRGVTLTSTADVLTPAQLSQLPFNIQETKLIHHGSGYDPKDFKHPLNMIPAAIRKGWQELNAQPNYLDLPAYGAVRSPFPAADANGESSVNRLLVLCSFAKDHEPNWLHTANALVAHYPDRQAVRMLDVASPRLVGQALYEGIRWAHTCLVDWTGWRANVFFEFGVRLACADIGPVKVIELGAAEAAAAPDALRQRQQLIALFEPAGYRVAPDDDAIEAALLVHDAIVDQRPPALAATRLPHDATHCMCREAFEWKREHITVEPHELLRSSIEAPFGKDPQAAGRSPLLFSTNPDYNRELDRSVKERWIAAWYYLGHRYPQSRWREDRALRDALRRLGNDVLQFGIPAPNEPHLLTLRNKIYNVIDKLDELDELQDKGAAHHDDSD
jgi:hypothetical protein